ncbi:MAG: hypothetical protein IJI46_00725 [Erysipelotrichaceae bacterium]|nr:hypothetical protein [Erysipelotrichaceae bacterium]
MTDTNYIERKNIVCDGVFIGTLNFKPLGAIGFVTILGAALIMLRTQIPIIIGILLILLGIVAFFAIKDKKLIDFYSDAAVIYDPQDNDRAYKLDYEDLDYWSVDSANRVIFFVLKDERVIRIDSMRYVHAYNLLAKTIPGKKERSRLEKFRNKSKEGKDTK